MANQRLLLLVFLSLISSSFQDLADNKVDSKDESPLSDVANEILKEQNLENIRGMVSGFIQSGGAKQVIDGVLQNLGGENSGQLLDNLGSIFNSGGKDQKSGSKEKKTNGDVNPMELLSGIGSLMGALQGAGGAGGEPNPLAMLQGLGSLLGGGDNQATGGAALLQGLGSLLGKADDDKDGKGNGGSNVLQGLGSILGAAMANQGGDNNNAGALLQGLGALMGSGQDGQGGINPEMIGNVINMFSDSQTKESKPSKTVPKKATSDKVKTKKKGKAKAPKNKSNGLNGVLSLAKSLLGDSLGKNKDLGNIDLGAVFEKLPLILNLAKSFGGPKVKKYFDTIDDVSLLYTDLTANEENPNYAKSLARISRIFLASNELFSSISTDKRKTDDEGGFDFSSLLSMANLFLSQKSGGKDRSSGESSFMDYLPMILNTINAFTGPEAQERADSHSDHSWSLPPVLEKIHVYYDTFINSDMGKQIFSFIGDQSTFKVFQNEKGNFSYDKFEELIENHSFRRHWIQQIASKIVDLLQKVSNKNIYNQYIDMGIMFTNSFLQKSGFPKKTLLDTKKPAKSLTNLADYVAKKYLGAEVETKEYVEPVVSYIQDILKMAHKSISPGAQSKELTNKITDTINMEIIEPITRVNRAYRYAKSEPKCDRYVYCLINQDVKNYSESLPGLKKGLYKVSSFITGWFLTSHTGTSYWELYAVITNKNKCNIYYHETCNGFHEEEIKATTEYVHNEL